MSKDYEAQRQSKTAKPCGVTVNGELCGKVAWYVVGSKYFCEHHRREAVIMATKSGKQSNSWSFAQ